MNDKKNTEKEPVLVIMAAGMGSRYGGLKQVDKMTEAGEIMLDFSLYDAMMAGFSRAVFVIKEENRDILTRLLQGKGDAAHEAAVAANVAMLMRLHGHEDLQANAQTVLEVLRSGSAYDRVTALAARG